MSEGRRVSLVIAETALELVPRELYRHMSVRNHAQRLGKKASEILLDRSFHHSAMTSGQIKLAWKRGRPDIAHLALQEALSTPLYLDGLLDVYIHTIDNKVIKVGPDLRVPKSYFRFEGVIMKLFKDKTIRDKENKTLLELHDNITFENLINNMIGSNNVVGLTSIGAQCTADQIVFRNCSKSNSNDTRCTFVIGGFPKGHFSECTSKLFHHSYSIGRYALESHVVIARIIYECEKIMLCGDDGSGGAYE
jgi:rRNA small subunit pseudouridine methyltransferase Nep1